MSKEQQTLLFIDGMVNVIVGIILILFPLGIAGVLGLPRTSLDFYPTIMGAIILGIGIALFVERYGYEKKVSGLGLAGAITINLCGGLALLVWLIVYPLNLPLHGYIILWSLAIIVLAIGLAEILTRSWSYK